jgi:LacI family transcriptional regulator
MVEPGERQRAVTVADVARRAGVSKATAARALGDYGAVSDSVRERVQAAAEELDYRPNELARSMNTGKSKTIGVIVGDIENGYFGLAMRGISDTAKAAGYDVILINTSEDVQAEIDAVRVLLDKRVDGLIVAPASSFETEHLRRVDDSGRPLVLLDRRVPGLEAVSVQVDIAPSASDATTALLDAGHTRIAFVSALQTGGEGYSEGLDLRVSSVTDRLAGILQALRSHGIEPSVDLIRFGAQGSERTRAITEDLLALEDPPTAILASDSLIALDVLRTLRDRGLRVPDDLSFVMFDDFDWAALTDPPLTVVAQPIYDVGVAAATILLRRLAGLPHDDVAARLPATLVLRDSIGAVPVRA